MFSNSLISVSIQGGIQAQISKQFEAKEEKKKNKEKNAMIANLFKSVVDIQKTEDGASKFSLQIQNESSN